MAYRRLVAENKIPKPPFCKICGCAGRLRWHGRYERTLITIAKTYILPVNRLFCVLCRRTFVLLPDFVQKFHHYAVETIRFAVKKLKACTYEQVSGMFMGQDDHRISPLTLYFWRRKFS